LDTLHFLSDLFSSKIDFVNLSWEYSHLIKRKFEAAKTNALINHLTISQDKNPLIGLSLDVKRRRVSPSKFNCGKND